MELFLVEIQFLCFFLPCHKNPPPTPTLNWSEKRSKRTFGWEKFFFLSFFLDNKLLNVLERSFWSRVLVVYDSNYLVLERVRFFFLSFFFFGSMWLVVWMVCGGGWKFHSRIEMGFTKFKNICGAVLGLVLLIEKFKVNNSKFQVEFLIWVFINMVDFQRVC